MVKDLTIGYGDRDGYERTDPEVRAAAHAHDERLRAKGAISGIAGTLVQVRNPGGTGMTTTAGQYLSADLPVAGFGLIDADSLEGAVTMVAEAARSTPGCRAFPLSADLVDPGRINVHEEWDDVAALERFRGTGASGDQQDAIQETHVAQQPVAATTLLS